MSLEPIEGVTFSIRYADGRPVDNAGGAISSNGIYTTNCVGEIVITDVTGTILITEEKSVEGYSILPNCKTKAVTVNPGDGQTIVFLNDPQQTLVLQKYITGTTIPIEGAKYLLTDSGGEELGQNDGIFTTDQYGRITVGNLEIGTTVTAKEISVPEPYVLDTKEHSIKIKQGDAQNLVLYNDVRQLLTIQKYVDGTTTPIQGVRFRLTDGGGKPIGNGNGEYETDASGAITLFLEPGTTVIAKEIRTVDGYEMSGETKNIVIGNGLNELVFYDRELGKLIIQKYIAGTDYEPLAGVCFEVRDGSGALIGPDNGLYYTNAQGEIMLDNLEIGSTLTVREVKTVDGFVLDSTPQTIEIRGGSEAQKLAFWNLRAGEL